MPGSSSTRTSWQECALQHLWQRADIGLKSAEMYSYAKYMTTVFAEVLDCAPEELARNSWPPGFAGRAETKIRETKHEMRAIIRGNLQYSRSGKIWSVSCALAEAIEVLEKVGRGKETVKFSEAGKQAVFT